MPRDRDQKGRIGISMTLTRRMSMFSIPPPSPPTLSLPVTVRLSCWEGYCNDLWEAESSCIVAHKKIYAIATSMRFDYKLMNLSRFEVFDLDSNKWSCLILNKKLTCVWVRFSKYCRFLPYFDRSAVFVEDTLYSIYNYTLAAFRPTSESEPEAKAKGLFDRLGLLSSDVGDAIEDNLRVKCPSAYLVHLGNRIFYYVSTGSLPDPKIPDHLYYGDTEKRKISIITFEVLRETCTESSNEGDKTFVQSKLLRTHNLLPEANVVLLLILVFFEAAS
ncbi:hypothetical protein CsSME_00038432 [Camellia sinensis var. sinensis]